VAYLNEMIQAQEILLKDALAYTQELEEQIKIYRKEV